MSLAALLGLDARLLLATDDPATHAVYDKVIEQARAWWLDRAEIHRHNQAVVIIEQLANALGGK